MDDSYVKGPLDRTVASLAGALLGACFIAFLESVRASREWRAPMVALLFGDAAVLVPLATALGLVVALAAIALGPRHSWTLYDFVHDLGALQGERRARWSVLAAIG